LFAIALLLDLFENTVENLPQFQQCFWRMVGGNQWVSKQLVACTPLVWVPGEAVLHEPLEWLAHIVKRNTLVRYLLGGLMIQKAVGGRQEQEAGGGIPLQELGVSKV
jgi:hypothetical protein